MRTLSLVNATFEWRFYETDQTLYFHFEIEGMDGDTIAFVIEKLDLVHCDWKISRDGERALYMKSLPESRSPYFSIRVILEEEEMEMVEEFISELGAYEVMMTCSHEFEHVANTHTVMGLGKKYRCKYCGVKKFENELSDFDFVF